MPRRLGTDVGGLWGKVKWRACIIAGLGGLAGSEKLLTGCIKRSVERSQESESTLGQNLPLGLLSNFCVDFQASSHGNDAFVLWWETETGARLIDG